VDGDAALQGFIARIRRAGALPAEVAKEAAPVLEAEARASADAGVTPDGQAWPEKKGGGRALAEAASAIAGRAAGAAILLTLKGVYVLHSRGKGHAPRRQILPDGGAGLPANIAAALNKAAAKAFARVMGGG
jgi:hypothetical protein